MRVEVLDISGVKAKSLDRFTQLVVASDDSAEVTVPAGGVALRSVDGVLDEVLDFGRHAAWTSLRKVSFAVLDLCERILQVSGQKVRGLSLKLST